MKKLTTVEDYYKLSLLEQYRRSQNIRKCYGKHAEGDFYRCYDADLKGVTPRGKVLQRLEGKSCKGLLTLSGTND